MKSYKDFPKGVIMNAPEGAMWVTKYGYPDHPSYAYYTWASGTGRYKCYFIEVGHWVEGFESCWKSLQEDPCMIPLPNVTIPWEATEDSECPVPEGTFVDIVVTSPEGDSEEDVKIRARSLCWKNYQPGVDSFWKITSYKIIDPEYVKDSAPSATEDNKSFVEDVVSLTSYVGQCDMQKEIHSAVSTIHSDVTLLHSKEYTLQQQLTQNLKFLQNLGKEFPEIQEETLAMMKEVFYNYMMERK
jgi:hypothetical protein